MGFFNFGVCGLVGIVCFLMIFFFKSVLDVLFFVIIVFFDLGFFLGFLFLLFEDELLFDWFEVEILLMMFL